MNIHLSNIPTFEDHVNKVACHVSKYKPLHTSNETQISIQTLYATKQLQQQSEKSATKILFTEVLA